MTGFARGEFDSPWGRMRFTITTFNHRHLDIYVDLPGELTEWKYWIWKELEKGISKGRVFFYLEWERDEVGREPDINWSVLEKYLQVIERFRDPEGRPFILDLSSLLRLPGVLRFGKEGRDRIKVRLKREIEKALGKLNQMRMREGEELAKDIYKRLERIKKLAQGLRSKIKEREKDEEIDIAEEITRINSHLKMALRELKKKKSSGMKLDFLAQELLRETNSVASKVQNPSLSYQVVEMKTEINRIREQLRNVV